MIKKITSVCLLLFLAVIHTFAQEKDTTSSFKFSGYVDTYYAYYTDSVGTNNYSKFPVISPRSNVFGLNIIQFTGQYTSDKIRAIGTIHYGDIPASAWAAQPFNMIQDANIGFKLCKNLWLAAGFFKTHIGTEALLPKDNIASTLSVITVYEPWFQAGAKLTYTPNENLTMSLHLLNGYNTFVETNKSKSIGMAITYLLGKRGSIGYYNLIGDESHDSVTTSHLRVLNNLVFTYELTNKLKVLAGVDYIYEQHSSISDSTKAAFIYSGILTFRYQLTSKLGAYARGELFNDANGMLTGKIADAQNKQTGYILTGETAGLEYKVSDNSYIRLEGRQIQMDKDQKIFRTDGAFTNVRTEVMLHCGVWF